MPTTAPRPSSLTLHKYLHLKNKLQHRPAATYFTVSPEDLARFNELKSRVAPIIKETPLTHA